MEFSMYFYSGLGALIMERHRMFWKSASDDDDDKGSLIFQLLILSKSSGGEFLGWTREQRFQSVDLPLSSTGSRVLM